MALISATAMPFDDIPTTDIEGERGPIAGLTIDGVTIYLGTYADPAAKDAAIILTANMLIGVLVGLRDSAVRRVQAKVTAEWAEAEVAYGR
jgi:hypothetical protein